MAGIDMVHVPYKGTTPAISALLGGEVSVMFATVTGIQPHIRSGRARALAVTTAKRSNFMPDVPTVSETLPGFEMLSWFGLLAPAGAPPAVIARMNAEVGKVLTQQDVRTALAAQGLEVTTGTPEQFGSYIRSEIAKITKIAKRRTCGRTDRHPVTASGAFLVRRSLRRFLSRDHAPHDESVAVHPHHFDTLTRV
jgi:tripartite-type tricarboxylate transporter receptor subunit TctC